MRQNSARYRTAEATHKHAQDLGPIAMLCVVHLLRCLGYVLMHIALRCLYCQQIGDSPVTTPYIACAAFSSSKRYSKPPLCRAFPPVNQSHSPFLEMAQVHDFEVYFTVTTPQNECRSVLSVSMFDLEGAGDLVEACIHARLWAAGIVLGTSSFPFTSPLDIQVSSAGSFECPI